MYEFLTGLSKDAVVVDLGSAHGSFAPSATRAKVVRIDRDLAAQTLDGNFVCADAAALPLQDQRVDVVIANHSLEHFGDLSGSLAEIRRIIKPGGSLFVAVPDASTLTDKIYRWLARGGGHVNAFVDPACLAAQIESATGLRHVSTGILYSSLSFLNRNNMVSRPPRRLLLLGGGSEISLLAYSWLSRRLDHIFGLRTSIYGWAFYFGSSPTLPATNPVRNVCIRCGSGVRIAEIHPRRAIFGLTFYDCPNCGTDNVLSASPA